MNNPNAPAEALAILPMSGRLYTISQMAKLLNLSTNWFYERTRRDAIPFHKLGKHIRFTESDLATILRMCSHGPQAANCANSTQEQIHG
jgi:excisionase family DNA binding protein